MKKLLLVLSIIALIVALILYLAQEGKIKLRDDPQAMKQEVLKKVPIGSPIQDARKIMEENGFAVAAYENADFVEYPNGDYNREILHKGEDFLLCYKKSTPFFFVTREWMIIIVHGGDVVSDIFVNTGLTGL